MKILNTSTILFCFVLVSTLTSCVTAKKYKAVENSLLVSETELLNRRREVNELKQDTLQKGQLYQICLTQKKELEDYNQYSESQLYKELNRLQADLDKKDGKLIEGEDILKETKKELEKKQKLLKERTTKLNAMQTLLVEQNKLILELRFMVAGAITGFGEVEPLVEVKDGKIFISIQKETLFRSNNTRIRSSGETGLLQLANTFAGRSDIHVTVVGHTKSKKPSGYADNWDLSTRQAVSVTRTLIKGGLLPTQITASGKAEFEPLPVVEGEIIEPENNSKNDRIEIILAPDMSRLYQLLNMD